MLKPANNSKLTPTILHLIDTTGPGGAETVFIQLADKLREKGFRSVVVIRGKGWVHDQLIKHNFEPIIIPAKGSFELSFLKQLAGLIKREKVDLIQSHLLGSNVYASIAGLITRTPVVATYHGMVDINPNERFRMLKHLFMKIGIKRYIAVSQKLMENIKQQGLLDEKRTKVIYNGVDLDRFEAKKSSLLRKQLGLDQSAILIGSLGNIRPAKAYDQLISAGACLLKTRANIHFVIAGHQKPELMQQLNEQISELGINGNFHFIGFQDDSAEFLRQVDVFALSSSSEGFSIATIEAMAAQLPILVTRCGGPEEIVTPDVDGLMVETNNPQAIADGLDKLIESSELANQLKHQASKTVRNRFSLDSMVNSYANEYKKLIH